MRYAIIAAGEGSRLAQEGISLPKPLVKINGEAMIDRLIRIFQFNKAEEIVIIVNTLNPKTEQHVRKLMETDKGGNIRLVVKSTPSSMHSFSEIAPYLREGNFCLTTVDTIFREEEFAEYIRAFESSSCDGMMAVTDFIDDESPLYVEVDNQMKITDFLNVKGDDCRFISGGIYALTYRCLPTLDRCMKEGQSRMRNFQRGLIADNCHLIARPFSKILDVDHAADIQKAEDFLNS